MKTKLIITVIAMVLMALDLQAQTVVADNMVGFNHQIKSEVLGEDREVQIYLPPSYQDAEKEYPVIYVLDGQRFFLHTVSLSQSFQQFQLAPEFIIVGIKNSYPHRFRHFGEGRENFKGFIKNELLPYVNQQFRTNGEDLLFGWEYGGSFTFDVLLNEPSLFDAYLVASPFPIFDAIDAMDSMVSMDTKLYFAVSPDEYDVRHSTEKLSERLTQKTIDGLEWKYFEFALEEHRSTGYPTLYHGLRDYFKYYQEFETNNLQKFINEGGVEYAKKHAQERAKRYGFSPELSLWSRFTIVRSAMRANDFYHFETLLNSLGKEDLVSGLVENRDYAVADFATFYEKNHRYKEAIELYDLLLKKHPDSETLQTKRKKVAKALTQNK